MHIDAALPDLAISSALHCLGVFAWCAMLAATTCMVVSELVARSTADGTALLYGGVEPHAGTQAMQAAHRHGGLATGSRAADAAAAKPFAIPRRLWQTYRSSMLPGQAQHAVETWTQMNPGMPAVLYSDLEASAFMNNTFGREVRSIGSHGGV